MSKANLPITFQIYQGDTHVRTVTLTEDLIRIGKLGSSHLKIDGDENVSRMHAVIEVNGPGQVFIMDTGSTGGTFVNGEKVGTKAQVNAGDQITLGSDTKIVVEMESGGGVLAATHSSSSGAAPSVPPAFAAAAFSGVESYGHGGHGHEENPEHYRYGIAASAAPVNVAEVETAQDVVEMMVMWGDRVLHVQHVKAGQAFSVGDSEDAQRKIAAVFDPAMMLLISITTSFIAFCAMSMLRTGELPNKVFTTGAVIAGVVGAIVFFGGFVAAFLQYKRVQAMRQDLPDYTLPENVGLGKVVMLTNDGSVVIPPGAEGEVTVTDQTRSFADLAAQGQLQSGMSGQQYRLPPRSTATIRHRGFTFMARPVNAGRPVGVPVAATSPKGIFDMLIGMPVTAFSGATNAERFWTGLSGAIIGLVLILFYFLPPRPASLSLDLLGADSRLVQYLMEPPETVEEEVPEFMEENANDTEGGTGKRHAGDEGAMGEESAQKTRNRFGIEGPQDNEDPHMAREAARENAANAGAIGVLASMVGSWNSPTSPFGQDTALGNDAMSALGALMGDQVGSNFGFGGLGLRGTGRGGGGTGEGTIGLGNLGTIGHGSGGGTGSGYGSGAGGFSGRSGGVPRIRTAEADVRGSLSAEVIRRVIRRHINEVRFCYEQQLAQRPDLAGRVTVNFIISPTGSVQSAAVSATTLNNSTAEGCITGAVRRWVFPAPDGGGIVGVNYPFVLEVS